MQENRDKPLSVTPKKRPASPSADAKPEPFKRQRVQPSERAMVFLKHLYLHAHNSNFRTEYAQEINECFSLAYAQKKEWLMPEIKALFEKRDACRATLQGVMNQARKVLGKERSQGKSACELLHLLEQECAVGGRGSIEYDPLDVDEESHLEEQKSTDQTVLTSSFDDSPERQAQKLSSAIEKQKINDLSITAWCSSKETFAFYVRSCSTRVIALSKSHRAFLLKPIDPGANNHFLAREFPHYQGLQRAVMHWEDHLEHLSLDRLNGMCFSHDPSVLHEQLAKLKHLLGEITKFGTIVPVSSTPRMFEEKARDLHNKYVNLSKYLGYAKQITSFFCDDSAMKRNLSSTLVDAVFLAAEAGHVSMTSLLLESFLKSGQASFGAIRTFDALVAAVICRAACHGRCVLLGVLLRKYQPNVFQWEDNQHLPHVLQWMSNISDMKGISLLEVAVRRGGTPAVVLCVLNYIEGRDEIEMLLQEPDDASACSLVAAAMSAVEQKNEEVFLVMLPYLIMGKPNCNAFYRGGEDSLLLSALKGGHLNIVRILIEKLHVDPNFFIREYAKPIHVAVGKGDLELVKCLLAAGARIEEKNGFGNTPLLHAIRYREFEIAKHLIDVGADVHRKTVDENTALMLALNESEHPQVYRAADERGRIHQKRSTLPTGEAVDEGRLALLKSLIYDKRIDIEARNSKGDTALMFAVRYDYSKIARLLIDALANVSVENDAGQTPITLAVDKGEGGAVLTKHLMEVAHGRIPENVQVGNSYVYSFFEAKNVFPETVGALIQAYLGNDFRA